jgi:alpha-glucoside transport system substrate-binding protein
MFKRTVVLTIVCAILMTLISVPAHTTKAQDEIQCFGAEGSEVSILATWGGEEQTKFLSAIDPVVQACDLTVNYEGTRDFTTVLDTRVQGGDAPDIAMLPNPGALAVYADQLVALDELQVNADNYAQGWVDLGTIDDRWIGLPVKTDVKSLVWYSPVEFENAGYTVPTTIDEMVALMDQMVADGDIAPLSMGFESGTATGWTATDFVQDLMVRTQSQEFVNGLVTGDTAWNDEGVAATWQMYVDWVNQYGLGGAEAAISTPFADAVLQPFSDPPTAWMVKQSGFAGSAVIAPTYPDYVYGEDYAFFPFPSADGEPAPMQVGGDFLIAFNNTPAVQAMVAFVSSAAGANAWAASGLDLTPNGAVDVAPYTDAIAADKAAALLGASDVIYDIGDRLPGSMGQAEFDGITAVVGGADLQETLGALQSLAEEEMSN